MVIYAVVYHAGRESDLNLYLSTGPNFYIMKQTILRTTYSVPNMSVAPYVKNFNP